MKILKSFLGVAVLLSAAALSSGVIINQYRFGSAPYTPPAALDLTGIPGWVYAFEADQLTGLSDGDPVSSATEHSGNNFTVTASGSNRPTWHLNSGHPCLRFDSDDLMTLTNVVSSDNAYTAFIVVRFTGTDSAGVFHNGDNSGGTNGYGFICYDGTTRKRSLNHSGHDIWQGSATTSSREIITALAVNNGAHNIWVNGVTDGSLAAMFGGDSQISTPTTKFTLGGGGPVDIEAIFIWHINLGQPDREALEDAISSKYGISVSH